MTLTPKPLTFALLRLLADGEFHSGQVLARQLGMSRASVHNALQDLDAYGLELYSVRGRGYKLSRSVQWLDAARIADGLGLLCKEFSIEILDSAPSSNTLLLQRAAQGAPGGSVVAVEWQSGGRGRQGRPWHSGLGNALTFSVLWRFDCGLSRLSGLSLAVGVAVMRALHGLGVKHVGLKWPNDVLFQFQFESEIRRRQMSDEDSASSTARSESESQRNITDEMESELGSMNLAQRDPVPLAHLRDNQRLSCGLLQLSRMASCFTQKAGERAGGHGKLAGILVEAHGDMLGPSAVVIGIGLNLALPKPVSDQIDQPAACLADMLDEMPERNFLLAVLLKELHAVLKQFAAHGFAAMRAEWQRYDALQGHPLQLQLPDGSSVTGIARGVDEDGSLSLETDAGLRRFNAGEISLRSTV